MSSTKEAKQDALRAILWTALSKVAAKESRRDLLEAGAKHDISFTLVAHVNEQPLQLTATSLLTIGHDDTRSVSHAVPVDHLVAYLLGELPATRRNAILRLLPEEFAACGNALPPADAGLLEAAENLLGRLRSKVTEPVRGAVSATYRIG